MNARIRQPLHVFGAACLAISTAFINSAWPQTPSAEEIVKNQLASFYQAGRDFQADVQMRLINPRGSQRERAMRLLRVNTDQGGDQRYLVVFDAPADVRGTAFLVWKYPKKEDERWLYFPALKLVKRVAADDKRSSFVGSDFTYEDISGRDLEEETHTLVKQETLDGRPTYVVESQPKAPATYAKRLAWIDAERWVPLKEEYYDAQGKLQRTFKADKVENIDGHWTITTRSMADALSGHRTEVTFKATRYDQSLAQDMFVERNLRNALTIAK
jgi:outer membrane lipoprotein-sorting protein